MSTDKQHVPHTALKGEGITARMVVIAILAVVFVTYFGCFGSVMRYDLIGTGHLPRSALYPVFILLLINLLGTKSRARWRFSKGELLFLYCALLVISGFPGQQFANYVYIGLVGPIYFATPQNRHQELFHGYIKDWMVPSKDPTSESVRWLYERMPEGHGFMQIPWGDWLRPLLIWTPMLAATFFLMLCMSVLLRKQWVTRERLLFPLAQVALEITDEAREEETKTPLFRNRLFWIAFAIPTVFFLMRGLAFYPWFQKHLLLKPDFWQLRWNTGNLFTEEPWNQFNWLEMNIYFDMLGISYLLASEIGFSFWFFYIFRRLETMMRITAGVRDQGLHFQFQDIGGFLVLFAFYFWIARSHIRDIIAKAFFYGKNVDDSKEPVSYRFAFWGMTLSFIFILGWWAAAGMSLIWCVALFGVYLMFMVVLTRIVSEAGLFVFWLPLGPREVLMFTTGNSPAIISPRDVTLMSMADWNLWDSASDSLPNMLQSWKLTTERNLRGGQMFAVMCGAMLLSMVVCHVAMLHSFYTVGIPNAGWWWNGATRAAMDSIVRFLTLSVEPHASNYGSMLQGGAFTALLLYLRQRFLWWPFHPLGFVGSFTLGRYWFSILLGWLIKVIVVQIGGVRLWRKLVPAALGIILGNAFILFTWYIIQCIPGYTIPGVLVIE